MTDESQRTDPHLLRTQILFEEQHCARGQLRIFAADVAGKSYALLEGARRRKGDGVDVAGYIETDQRVERRA